MDKLAQLRKPPIEDSIHQSIRIILLTRPGEQLMRPNFGAGLANFLHAPNTLVTRRRIRDAVQTALLRWEPRIDLQRVEVWEVENQSEALRVEIVYRVKRTGTVKSMSLTLTLES